MGILPRKKNIKKNFKTDLIGHCVANRVRREGHISLPLVLIPDRTSSLQNPMQRRQELRRAASDLLCLAPPPLSLVHCHLRSSLSPSISHFSLSQREPRPNANVSPRSSNRGTCGLRSFKGSRTVEAQVRSSWSCTIVGVLGA